MSKAFFSFSLSMSTGSSSSDLGGRLGRISDSLISICAIGQKAKGDKQSERAVGRFALPICLVDQEADEADVAGPS